MCQIFGINSLHPIAPNYLLRGFFCRGGGTSDHEDGWGIAYRAEDGRAHLKVHASSAFRCQHANTLAGGSTRSRNLMAHIRKATIGAIEDANSHPFTRTLWGKRFFFAHNGDLKAFDPEIASRFRPSGTTDSETAFASILTRLVDRFGDISPPLPALFDALQEIATDIARHGTFNFILTVDDLMFAHATTDLHWTTHPPGTSRVRLIDCNEQIDTGALHHANERFIIVATHPVTEGHRWQRFGVGELALFHAGQRLYITEEMAPDWCEEGLPALAASA
ncbi:MAG: class II glutamine amidotransferase [Salinicola sp.]|uniref:class II glutamine amidotransferase n=1 Tax=uncultured Salinicola sp. TaxID=1193542 RepID=UPI000C8C7D18|nr:class II glutamine amidotransferase [uncultured Salinicola sp.]MAM57410.1 class II glutamine amidotransferase [Salinicola sp.]|tara:strand:+ start:816 stop:1649 length:834 start_codon:yes stop_codon:yes gene_type:complete